MAKRCKISPCIVAESEQRSFVLKVDGYKTAKKLFETGKLEVSAPFTVGGYSWVMKWYPNGIQTEYAEYISVYLALDSAAHAKDVKANFTLSLLDKAGEPAPLRRRPVLRHAFSSKASNWGHHNFIKRTDLEGSDHLRDDSFSIRCDITVLKDIQKGSKFVVVPPSDLHIHLDELLNSMDEADVVFHVGGERFSAHRTVLAARSSVFKAELFGAMKEKAGSPIEIHDMEADVFKSLLRFIYTDSLPWTTREGDAQGDVVMASHLLVAADRYNIERLKLICEEKMCHHIDSDMVATTLALAEQHSCDGLKEACFEFLACPSNLGVMIATDGYQHLRKSCPSVLKELVARLLPAELQAAKDILMAIY